ncbi:MAG: preprotein translocase subunit YajC [Actinomycetota bacterium]|nr:preprotein translocase subunit YajC [Actinomycetota bacterium]
MQSPVGSLIFLVLLVGLFYFMLLRPQRKRVEMHRRLMESLGDGDEVVTIGGVFGTVESLGNDDVVLQVAPGTSIRVLKSAIARKLTDEPELEEGEEEIEEAEEE